MEDFKKVAGAVSELLRKIAEESQNQPKKEFTPEQIRKVATRFKRNTSTGTDHWKINDIILMPDPVLKTLGDLLSEIQHTAVPPLQMMNNIMATLPKKSGGTRTVAIAATLYRILMELDNDEVADYEQQNAFHGIRPQQGHRQSRRLRIGLCKLNWKH